MRRAKKSYAGGANTLAESSEQEPKEDYTLRFVLDGVRYALENNLDEQAAAELRANFKFWFPGVVLDDELPEA